MGTQLTRDEGPNPKPRPLCCFTSLTRYKFILILNFEKGRNCIGMRSVASPQIPPFLLTLESQSPALIKGEETIACTNGVAKKVEKIIKAIPIHSKRLGGKITYRKQRMKFLVFRLLLPLVA